MISYVMDDDKYGEVIMDSVQNVFFDVGKGNKSYVKNDTMYYVESKPYEGAELADIDDPDSVDWGSATISDLEVTDNTLYLLLYEDADTSISGADVTSETGISDTRFIYWPKLKFGKNEFRVTGDCSFLIRYREPRKVGDV